MNTPNDDDNDIVNEVEQTPDLPEAVIPAPSVESLDVDVADEEESSEEPAATENADLVVDQIDSLYDTSAIDLRGLDSDELRKIFDKLAKVVGDTKMIERIRQPNTLENLLYKALQENSTEEERIQEALGAYSKEENAQLSDRLRDESGKTLLRISSPKFTGRPGERVFLTGHDAMAAFENANKKTGDSKGTIMVPLYNSGITVELICPTGSAIQTMLDRCVSYDREMGALGGGHYFAHADHHLKNHIVEFVNNLIIWTSFGNWRKNGQLWSLIKPPDLETIVMAIAAMWYRDGYDNFRVPCVKMNDDGSVACGHVSTLNVDLTKMILPRFSILPKAAIDHMVATRMKKTRHTQAEVLEYQKQLGLENEKVEVAGTVFTMKIPTMTEHLEHGAQFIASIENEVGADNTEGQYNQMGLRYIRAFVPWIYSAEVTADDGTVIATADAQVITRQLERLNDNAEGSEVLDALRKYVNKTQITYIGHPTTECPACGHLPETASGLHTIDPFATFFTLASQYITKVF